MILPLAAVILYLMLSVRVLADLAVDAGGRRSGLRLAFRAWGVRLCLDRPLKTDLNRESAGRQGKRLKQLWPLLRATLGAVNWGQIDVRMRIGLWDAYGTAAAAGAVQAVGAAAQSVCAGRFPCSIRVEADFRRPCFALRGRCIFSFAPGDIIFAAVWAAVKKTQREGFKWLSIPLKA